MDTPDPCTCLLSESSLRLAQGAVERIVFANRLLTQALAQRNNHLALDANQRISEALGDYARAMAAK